MSNTKVFKLKSSEVIIANIIDETDTAYEVEYIATFINTSPDKYMIYPAVPGTMKNLEILMKPIIIEKTFIWFMDEPSRQVEDMYEGFTSKVKASFSNIQIASSIPNRPTLVK